MKKYNLFKNLSQDRVKWRADPTYLEQCFGDDASV